ncbi:MULTISPECIES: hypothetical protein [unclassified Frankia]
MLSSWKRSPRSCSRPPSPPDPAETAAQLFLRAQLDEALHPPGAGYYLLVITGLVASLAVIASTMPLLAQTTGPEIARSTAAGQ